MTSTSAETSSPTRGDVWLVSLDPTVGAEIQKTRPAVVVSAARLDVTPLRIVVPLTTWQPRFADQVTKLFVPRNAANGLANDSAADFLHVRSLSVQRLGAVDDETLRDLAAGVALVVGYAPP